VKQTLPMAVQSWWKISLSNAHIWANVANGAKASAKAVHLVPIYLTILGES
jgi:hypothetical protein